MKFRSIIMMVGAMAIVAAIQVKAQSHDDSRVKILRTPDAGVVKLLYAINSDESLKVKFFTKAGVIATDNIEGSYPKGFLKRYDVKKISDNDFWIEIASREMILVYRMVPSKDKKYFTPHLEKATYNHPVVAQK